MAGRAVDQGLIRPRTRILERAARCHRPDDAGLFRCAVKGVHGIVENRFLDQEGVRTGVHRDRLQGSAHV